MVRQTLSHAEHDRWRGPWSLCIEVDTSLPSGRVVRVLEQVSAERGYPKQLRLDNGPEFISMQLMAWCTHHDVKLTHIQPGKPNQNAYIERFNKTYRQEVLDAYVFTSLEQVKDITDQWIMDYNQERPRKALNGLTPMAFKETIPHENSTLAL